MVIINNTKNQIINMDNVTNIFKGINGCTIKVNFLNGGGTQLEEYETNEITDFALKLLCEAIGTQEKYIMPTGEYVKNKIYNSRKDENYHNNHNGKKQKGHGGS